MIAWLYGPIGFGALAFKSALVINSIIANPTAVHAAALTHHVIALIQRISYLAVGICGVIQALALMAIHALAVPLLLMVALHKLLQ